MKNFTFLLTFLMIFSVKANCQFTENDFEHFRPVVMTGADFVKLDSLWCDFEGVYTNTGGFREAINARTEATDVAGGGVNGSTAIELVYSVNPDNVTTGYQMWAYPDMIDVSAYNYLVLNIKADPKVENVHLILLDNVSLHAEGNSQLPFNIGTEWEQIFLPLDSFKVQTGSTIPADLTILHLIQVLFINDIVSEPAGTVYIDEVGFTTDAVNVSIAKPDEIALVVYPNPARTYAKVLAKAGSQISLLNLNGCTISSQIANDNETSVSLSGLPQGVYLVRVTHNNKSVNRKLLVQ